jgi:Tol biopolymer transport system component
MNSRIVRIGLVVVAAAVVIAIGISLRPASNSSAQTASTAPPAASPSPSHSAGATLGKLAYARNGDIYLANWDGTHPVRIANGTPPGPANHSYGGVTWSPNGRYLAYVGESGKGASYHKTVYVRDATGIGGAPGDLLGSFRFDGWSIAWSPYSALITDTRIAAWVRPGRAIGIYSVNGVRDGLLTLPKGFMAPGDFDPVWSPDGASLVVPTMGVIQNGKVVPDAMGPKEYGGLISLGGSSPRQLPASDPRSHWAWWYSPDGSRVAYPDGSGWLTVAAADGAHAHTLVRAPVENAAWSPSGDQIAFYAPHGVGLVTNIGPNGEIGVVDVSSGRLTTLIGVGTGSVMGFSPDGTQVLFSRTARHVTSLWSVRFDGSAAKRLVTGAESGQWQPALR